MAIEITTLDSIATIPASERLKATEGSKSIYKLIFSFIPHEMSTPLNRLHLKVQKENRSAYWDRIANLPQTKILFPDFSQSPTDLSSIKRLQSQIFKIVSLFVGGEEDSEKALAEFFEDGFIDKKMKSLIFLAADKIKSLPDGWAGQYYFYPSLTCVETICVIFEMNFCCSICIPKDRRPLLQLCKLNTILQGRRHDDFIYTMIMIRKLKIMPLPFEVFLPNGPAKK